MSADDPAEAGCTDPTPVSTAMPVTLCSVCTEKLRRTDDGWEHFGADQPYEPYVVGDRENARPTGHVILRVEIPLDELDECGVQWFAADLADYASGCHITNGSVYEVVEVDGPTGRSCGECGEPVEDGCGHGPVLRIEHGPFS